MLTKRDDVILEYLAEPGALWEVREEDEDPLEQHLAVVDAAVVRVLESVEHGALRTASVPNARSGAASYHGACVWQQWQAELDLVLDVVEGLESGRVQVGLAVVENRALGEDGELCELSCHIVRGLERVRTGY